MSQSRLETAGSRIEGVGILSGSIELFCPMINSRSAVVLLPCFLRSWLDQEGWEGCWWLFISPGCLETAGCRFEGVESLSGSPWVSDRLAIFSFVGTASAFLALIST